jgi:hypothetical protein
MKRAGPKHCQRHTTRPIQVVGPPRPPGLKERDCRRVPSPAAVAGKLEQGGRARQQAQREHEASPFKRFLVQLVLASTQGD